MMNRCAYQQQNNNNINNNNNNALVRSGEMMNGVVCPKPRRLCLLNPSMKESIISTSSPRIQHHYPIHQTEMRESKSRMELLDMILTKECYGAEKANNVVPSSPPFFCGSPPSRAANPVVQDAQFGNENPNPPSPAIEASPSSRKNGGSCARGKFGQKCPAVRVEGFNCRGISAVA
ncbi:hypothetical protein L2E82_10175 [Cichorium intybus]|uniref:Uncharacterized protein n=1 Tax=Cichorium intybus TaxID=13427 RepID=A0ACB9G9C6_CICIN|nr:hypothetical protein L2E82_10175 [Cichorium intybus]